MFESFWQKINDIEGYKAKRERQRNNNAGVRPFLRQLSRTEVSRDRGMLVIGNSDWEYIIPKINLMPLDHVDFLVLAKRITDANPQRPLKVELMRSLWRMLMKEVYDFVQEPNRTAKLLEVSLP